ncbi:MAG: hypothetical protein Q4E76_01410 [Tissierellia bacterium]|nr:hypothetical protein [Tissierellia bacterium]
MKIRAKNRAKRGKKAADWQEIDKKWPLHEPVPLRKNGEKRGKFRGYQTNLGGIIKFFSRIID